MKLRYKIMHTPSLSTLAQVEDEQGGVHWSHDFTAKGLFIARQHCTHTLMQRGIVPRWESSSCESGSNIITTQFVGDK